MAADFKFHQLSESVYSIQELDDRNIEPINYLIVGTERVMLIDTGCGFSNIYLYVKNLPCVGNKNIIVVNTHNHAEQTAGNYRFSTTGKCGLSQRVDALCASGKHKYYTRLMNSTHHWEVKTYKITKWLEDKEKILLGPSENPQNEVQVFWTPGQTPDSICLWYAYANRIFIGDMFQRFSDILFIYEYTDIKEFETSLRRIMNFVKDKRPVMVRYSACRSENDGLCWPLLKQYHRFVLSILAGTQPGNHLRVDEEEGWRYESRDKSIKVVLSRRIVQQLLDARAKLQNY